MMEILIDALPRIALGVSASLSVFVLASTVRCFAAAVQSQAFLTRINRLTVDNDIQSTQPQRGASKLDVSSRQTKVILGAAGALIWVKLGVVPFALLAIGGCIALRSKRVFDVRKNAANYERSLPVALDGVARSLRSGAGTLIAFGEVPSNGGLHDAAYDLRRVAQDAGAGLGMVRALEAWAKRKPLKSVELCVNALSLAIECGSSNAQAVDQVSKTLRQHLEAIDEAKTSATEARASAGLLLLLPLLIAVPVLVANADARTFMFGSPVGIAALLIGLGLEVLGGWWMYRLVNRVAQ